MPPSIHLIENYLVTDMKYVKISLIGDVKETYKIEKFLERSNFKDSSLNKFVVIIFNVSIPHEFVQKCWNFLESNDDKDPTIISKWYSAFLKTSKAKEASSKFRSLKSVPKEVSFQ